MNKLVELYCDVDDFLQNIYPPVAKAITGRWHSEASAKWPDDNE